MPIYAWHMMQACANRHSYYDRPFWNVYFTNYSVGRLIQHIVENQPGYETLAWYLSKQPQGAFAPQRKYPIHHLWTVRRPRSDELDNPWQSCAQLYLHRLQRTPRKKWSCYTYVESEFELDFMSCNLELLKLAPVVLNEAWRANLLSHACFLPQMPKRIAHYTHFNHWQTRLSYDRAGPTYEETHG